MNMTLLIIMTTTIFHPYY